MCLSAVQLCVSVQRTLLSSLLNSIESIKCGRNERYFIKYLSRALQGIVTPTDADNEWYYLRRCLSINIQCRIQILQWALILKDCFQGHMHFSGSGVEENII